MLRMSLMAILWEETGTSYPHGNVLLSSSWVSMLASPVCHPLASLPGVPECWVCVQGGGGSRKGIGILFHLTQPQVLSLQPSNSPHSPASRS